LTKTASGHTGGQAPSLARWRSEIERLRGAYADTTLQGYRSDFAAFERWCVETGAEMLPATPETVGHFLAADAQTSSASTLKRRLAAIRKVHKLLRLPSPVEDEVVSLALRRALRTKRRRPKQALGLDATLRDQLIATCPDTLIGARDRAMIAVGYDTLCRRAELVNLLVEDVHPLPGGGGRVMVRRAKNDPFGDGRWASLSPAGLAELRRWLDRSGVQGGPIFRPIFGGRVGDGSLQPIVVNRTVKTAAARAKASQEVVASLSGHSMRVGAAQDLMVAGRDLLQIMTAGGWSSVNVVGRYVRDAEFNIWTS
jgi:site-specific recombinase XerD